MRKLTAVTILVLFLPVLLPCAKTADKIGIYVTPCKDNDSFYELSYREAIGTLKGNASTVWILESWNNIEKAPGVYDWSSVDERVELAAGNGFNIGLRLQFVLCGNDNNHKSVALSQVPAFIDQDMVSGGFRAGAERFYAAAAKRYMGRVKYLAIGNSVNNYFEKHQDQWEGFKSSYNGIVDAIHAAAPGMLVISDVNSSEKEASPEKYLKFFGGSNDDAVGLVFYFIVKSYYGDFTNFNTATMEKVLDGIHERTGKNLFILETSCFSVNPKNGNDMSKVQSGYVEMLFNCAEEREYLLGVSWWQLYDAKNLPGVPWDEKASFGLFESGRAPKPSWETWKKRYNGN